METVDGLIFSVKGMVHPRDRLIAYLRYLPDLEGDRVRDGGRYRRVYRFEEQQEALRAGHSPYLHDDPVFGMRLQAVPVQDVRRVHDPRHRLESLAQGGPADAVEATSLALARYLAESAGVPLGTLGISGSVLVGLHRPTSDVDLVVYGEEEGRALHRALCRLLDKPSGPVRRPHGNELEAIHEAHRVDTPLSLADFVQLQARKVNEGCFQGRPYFIRFVKRPDQVTERYGDPRFEPLGHASIRARVEDDRDAIFTPCRYGVDDVVFLEGTSVGDLREIVSFRGRFSEQARAGEWVLARGKLERVIPRNGEDFHRLTVGGRPGDYLLCQSA